MLRIILRQLSIFTAYLFACSYFLFNHSGGADLAFILFLVICIAIHFITILVLVYNNRHKKTDKKWKNWDILILIGIVGLFFLLAESYLDFMWWFTSNFQ